jgi:hypothetical protein
MCSHTAKSLHTVYLTSCRDSSYLIYQPLLSLSHYLSLHRVLFVYSSTTTSRPNFAFVPGSFTLPLTSADNSELGVICLTRIKLSLELNSDRVENFPRKAVSLTIITTSGLHKMPERPSCQVPQTSFEQSRWGASS